MIKVEIDPLKELIKVSELEINFLNY